MNYDYVRQTPIQESANGITYTIIKQENVNNYQLAGMFVNGLQFRITPFFTYRTFIGLGVTNADSDLSKAVKENLDQKPRSFVKGYLGMCVGYRFY